MNTLNRIASFFASIGSAGNWRHIPERNPEEWLMRDEIERLLIDRETRRQIF